MLTGLLWTDIQERSPADALSLEHNLPAAQTTQSESSAVILWWVYSTTNTTKHRFCVLPSFDGWRYCNEILIRATTGCNIWHSDSALPAGCCLFLKGCEMKRTMHKKHYVPKIRFDCTAFTDAACGNLVATFNFADYKEATYRRNHVTCGNCRRTKVFRGVR